LKLYEDGYMETTETVHTDKLKEQDSSCYENARRRGLDTFTLTGADLSSPKTICFWIMENIETAPVEKLVDALKHALVMRATRHRKHAD
jgi:hypothetical protein